MHLSRYVWALLGLGFGILLWKFTQASAAGLC